ncbi:hypothetical protein GIS00_02325 [Nakamurella sp. YIM 132087]|uniref:PucR family transcriptional regulator n=1 Tax=Nakamurella alba TaxID=2665158 RepID=A0A7K1FFC6_9ACTN|nr:helix-turn-helix domain-containing protein [Nakamurella alba]MTD12780.1 hypothetical protein [Nakamurella alba]
MTTLASLVEVLREQGTGGTVEVLVGDLDRTVREVVVVDDANGLAETGEGTLLVLDRRLSAVADSYRFDIFVRRALGHGVSGILLTLPEQIDVSVTALALCRKSGVPLLKVAPDTDLNVLVRELARQLADELHLNMDRVRRALQGMDDLGAGQDTAEAIVAAGSELLGRPITLVEEADPDTVSVPAVVTEPDGERLAAAATGNADTDALVQMVLWRLAVELSRGALQRRRAEQTLRRSAGELLLQLVDADRAGRGATGAMARRLGIPVDGRHAIVRIELENLTDLTSDDVRAYEQRDRMAAAALRSTTGDPGIWHVSHDISVLLLLCTRDATAEGTAADTADLQRTVRRVIGDLVADLPELRTFTGIGSWRAGIVGLAASASEARLAVAAARARRRVNEPVGFDAVGLRSGLIEWYSSPLVRESVDTLFAPLSGLSPAKRDSMIETLGTYLDLQGSITRTAERLHLHRNAVRYRIQRALDQLGIDEDDADQRLFLHLACRAVTIR